MIRLRKPTKQELFKGGKNFLMGAVLCAAYLYLTQLIFGAVCWVRLAFGFPCPLCGITRAAELFIKFDYLGAWQMHAMFYLVLLFVPFYIFCKYFVENGSKFIRLYVIIFGIIALIYYAYRMLTLFPEQEPLIYYADNWLAYLKMTVK